MLGEISASDVDRAWKGWILYLFIYSKFGYHSSGQVRFPKEQKLMFRFIFKFSGWNQIILRKRTRLLIHWRRQFHCSPKKVTFPSIESLHKAYTLSSKLVEPVSPSLTCKYHRSIQILYQYLYRITLHANECKPVFLPLPTSEAHWTRGLFLGLFCGVEEFARLSRLKALRHIFHDEWVHHRWVTLFFPSSNRNLHMNSASNSINPRNHHCCNPFWMLLFWQNAQPIEITSLFLQCIGQVVPIPQNWQ